MKTDFLKRGFVVKQTLVLIAIFFVMGCSMPETEKNRIAQGACSSLSDTYLGKRVPAYSSQYTMWLAKDAVRPHVTNSATSRQDSVERLRILNDARQELGEVVFSGQSDEIERYLRYGTCVDLVRNQDNALSKTNQRELALRKMEETADFGDYEDETDFDFDILTEDGSYFFWVTANEREKTGPEVTNGDLLLPRSYNIYVLDSESMAKVESAVIRGDINRRITVTSEFGHQISDGRSYGGRVEATLVNEKLEGVVSIWYENGQKRVEFNFVNGVRQGLQRGWHMNGQLEFKMTYINGAATGRYQRWYFDGQIMNDVMLVDNQKNGVQRRWNESGILSFERCYKSGVLVEKSQCFQ